MLSSFLNFLKNSQMFGHKKWSSIIERGNLIETAISDAHTLKFSLGGFTGYESRRTVSTLKLSKDVIRFLCTKKTARFFSLVTYLRFLGWDSSTSTITYYLSSSRVFHWLTSSLQQRYQSFKIGKSHPCMLTLNMKIVPLQEIPTNDKYMEGLYGKPELIYSVKWPHQVRDRRAKLRWCRESQIHLPIS